MAQVNYAYQWDVAAEPKSSRPESPDIFYLYESKSETIPLVLRVERESGAEFKVLNVTPSDLKVASKENVVQVTIENVGDDYARDLVARLRPESGIYVSVDESPILSSGPARRLSWSTSSTSPRTQSRKRPTRSRSS